MKWTDWHLPLNTSYGLIIRGIVFISALSQSLAFSVVTGECLLDAVRRNDICLNALKAALNLEEEVWWRLTWFLLLVHRQHNKIYATVYIEILKKHVPNLRTSIHQPAVFMQDNTPCHTAKSVKTLLYEEDVTVME